MGESNWWKNEEQFCFFVANKWSQLESRTINYIYKTIKARGMKSVVFEEPP